MELSLEIPHGHLTDYLPLCDFPFGLAHILLEEHPQSSAYEQAMHKCLLDNSMYERDNEPLPNELLIDAAGMCKATSVIAPDWEGEKEKTLTASFELRELAKPHNLEVGAVVQGHNREERVECFFIMQDAQFSPICFPFRSPRDETIFHLMVTNNIKHGEWYHLLGLNNLTELGWEPPGRWSIDTSKPFKGFRFDKTDSLRGHGRLDLEKVLTPDEEMVALWNISYMRRIMR